MIISLPTRELKPSCGEAETRFNIQGGQYSGVMPGAQVVSPSTVMTIE